MGTFLRAVFGVVVLVGISQGLANPYPDSTQVPVDELPRVLERTGIDASEAFRAVQPGVPIVRIQIDWSEGEQYSWSGAWLEDSGTENLLRSSRHINALGSYQGRLEDSETGAFLSADAIGTGKEFRKLTRALTFRFPVPSRAVVFKLTAENPTTGVMESVFEKRLDPNVDFVSSTPMGVDLKVIQSATVIHPILFNIYSEGYSREGKDRFFEAAERVAATFRHYSLPLLDQMEIRAVFAPSPVSLGRARDLGLPIPERQSFLGLYYPYWDNFGRWADVVYPTREAKFRQALASAPYDYALVLVDHDGYWGVGNFRELTAIPAGNQHYFEFLLMHELGHFFGLNEEYDDGGRTELEFAPGIAEPWSQNNTFLNGGDWAHLKWNASVAQSTPLPTPRSLWSTSSPVYGAYLGGYAGSEPRGRNHIPGLGCVMDRHRNFCPVCRAAIERVIRRDRGELVGDL